MRFLGLGDGNDFLVNYPGSFPRNQPVVFSTSPVMRPS